MINLIGAYECKADAKGRLMLPAGIKKQLTPLLKDGFILKRSIFRPCLELYPMSEWNLLVKDVNELNRFVKENLDFIRMFTTGLKPIELDSTGRVLIPKDLIEFSGIKKNIGLVYKLVICTKHIMNQKKLFTIMYFLMILMIQEWNVFTTL